MNLARLAAALCATALLFCAACRSSAAPEAPRPSAAEFFETRWAIQSVEGEPVIPGMDSQAPHVILRTKDRAYVGSTGVNRFFGGYVTGAPGSITLRPGGMTKMAGPEPLMRQEQRVLATLQTVDAYRVEGDQLSFSAQGRDVMVLRASAPQ